MIDPPPHFTQPPANDAGGSPDDVRERLRVDHDLAMNSLDALRRERDPQRCLTRLRELRTAWVVHALAEETVVYQKLGDSVDPEARANERFIEHEIVGGLFDRLAQAAPNSLEWKARLNVIRDLIVRHIESEYRDLFPRLERQFGDDELRELGERFRLAREKLMMLEQAKAA